MEKPESLTLDRIRKLFEEHKNKEVWVYKNCPLCGCPTELLSNQDPSEYRMEMMKGCINCRHPLFKGLPQITRLGSILLWDDNME